MTTSATTASNVRGIQFELQDYGQEFKFMLSINGTNEFGTARLQLPTTPDSINTISIANQELDRDDESYQAIYEALRDDFYDSFHSKDCAKASALLAKTVYAVEEIDGFYVAFSTDGTSEILKEGRASSYYNVFYFDKATADNLFDVNPSALVEEAKKQLSKKLASELQTLMSTKMANFSNEDEAKEIEQAADEFVHEFMLKHFHENYANDGSYAAEFYTQIACDIRVDAVYKLLD